MLRRLLLLSLPFLGISSTNAVYFDVNTCSPSKPCIHVSPTGKDTQSGTLASPVRTIQKALNLVVAPRPTRIVLQDGSYPGGVVWHGSSITLTSIHGSGYSFIDCQNIPNQRGLWIGSAETSSTVIEGVTIQNCNTTFGSGAAVIGENTKPIFRNVIFRQNQAIRGAGLFALFSSPQLIATEFLSNRARDGPGLYVVHNGTVLPYIQYQQFAIVLNYVIPPGPIPTGVNSVIVASDLKASGNYAHGIGAGIFAQGATLELVRATFSNNDASGSGCIGLGAGSKATIKNSSFLNNRAREQNAGAIAIRQGSSAVIVGSSFINNRAAEFGGALIVAEPLSTVNINQCIFNGNRANVGSIIGFDPNPHLGSTITNSHIANNVAVSHAGIWFGNVPTARNVNLASNTFSNNTAPFGADYGSIGASIGFVAPSETQIGDSTHTPSILPNGFQTTISRTIQAVHPIPLRIILADAFGQRVTAPGIVNDAFFEVVATTPPSASQALLVMQNSRVKLVDGVGDVTLTLLAQSPATYQIRVTTGNPMIPAAKVNVQILPCINPFNPKCHNCGIDLN